MASSHVKYGVIKALDYFPCPNFGLLFVYLLMNLGPVSQNCPNVYKTGITQTSDELNIRISPQLMGYVELKTMDYFSCIPEHDLGYSGQVFLNCLNTQIPKKQV